jgi:hypothetical protein
MEEIKLRIEVIRSFCNGKCNALYEQTTAESIALQIRKVLELIAMGSLVANKPEYQQIFKNFQSKWNAKNILKEIEEINPDFYPVPITSSPTTDDSEFVEVDNLKKGFLTKSEFIDAYARCGGMLHSDNPFGKQKDTEDFLKKTPKWVNKIITLLDTHRVKLNHNECQLWITMQSAEDNRVKGRIMSRL